MPKLYNPKYNKKIRANLRNNQTKYEKILWGRLKGRQIKGVKFNRQYGIGRYILDFYCPKAKIAIELDGNQHYIEEGLEYDEVRTKFLNSLGIKVLRFKNKEVIEEIEKVIKQIEEKIDLF